MNIVTIKNNTARAIPIVLDHPAFRKRKYGFRVRADQHVTETREGGRSLRIVRKTIPGSITLPARGVLKNLHPAICGCAQVRTLEKQGRISVRSESVEEPKEEQLQQTQTLTRPRRSRVVAEPEQPKEIEETNQ